MAGDGVRSLFLEAVAAVRPLLAEPALADRWDSPSALALLSVRGLAGHLLRAIASVDTYLDQPAPAPADPPPVSSGEYLARATADADLAGALHRGVRARGEEAAQRGPAALLADWDGLAGRLRGRLAEEPAGRLVQVFMGTVISLDDYLATRLVELCVHADDLAVSLDVLPPPLPAEAMDLAGGVLVDVARLRHGRLAVLRALARRERDLPSALRVL